MKPVANAFEKPFGNPLETWFQGVPNHLETTVRNSSTAYASRLTFMTVKMNITKTIIIMIPLPSFTTRPQHGHLLMENSRLWTIILIAAVGLLLLRTTQGDQTSPTSHRKKKRHYKTYNSVMTSSLNPRTKVVLWLSGNVIYTFRKLTASCRTTVFTNVLMLTPFSKIRKSSRTPLRTWSSHASYHQRLSILWSLHHALRGSICYPSSTTRTTLGVPLFLHAAAQPRTSQRTLMK